jgi:hypothetical protein
MVLHSAKIVRRRKNGDQKLAMGKKNFYVLFYREQIIFQIFSSCF